MALPDYYAVLQVAPTADSEVIEAAYKRLAFKHHPDRNRDPASAIRMRELNQAYEILCDSKKRRHYDQEVQSEKSLTDLYQKVNHLLDIHCTHNDIIKSLVEAGMDLETSARVVGTIVEHRRKNGVQEQPHGEVLGHFKADTFKIVTIYVVAALVSVVSLGFGLVVLLQMSKGGLSERFLVILIVSVPAILSGIVVMDAKKRWDDEVIVFPNRLKWKLAGKEGSFELSGIKSMTVVPGDGIVEFALQFINVFIPELVVVDSNDQAWRIKAYMERMDELCQVLPSLWTANGMGLR